jgi:hypothetical protein
MIRPFRTYEDVMHGFAEQAAQAAFVVVAERFSATAALGKAKGRSLNPTAWRLKAQAMPYEARLRGLNQPRKTMHHTRLMSANGC